MIILKRMAFGIIIILAVLSIVIVGAWCLVIWPVPYFFAGSNSFSLAEAYIEHIDYPLTSLKRRWGL